MVSRKTEEQYLLMPLVKHLEFQLSNTKPTIDFSDPYELDVEWFEIFFAFDHNVGSEITADSIDGWQALSVLVREATDQVIGRYGDRYQAPKADKLGIGICAKTEWYWGDEVPEIEAMVGTIREPDAIVGCWRFAVRFASRPEQVEGRCTAAEPKMYLLHPGSDPFEGEPEPWSSDDSSTEWE